MTALRQAHLVAGLTLVWMLLWGHVEPVTLASGIAVSVGVLALSRIPAHPRRTRLRWSRVPGVLGRLARDLPRSTWAVTRAVLVRGRGTRASVLAVEVPHDASDTAVAVLCNRISLEPGSVVVDLDREHDLVFVYQLDTPDPDAAEAARAQLQGVVRDVTSALTPRRPRQDTQPDPQPDPHREAT